MSSKNRFRKYSVTTMAAAVAATGVVPAAVSADTTPSSFPDVNPGDAHYEAIMALTQAGVIQGFEDGTFGKWEPVTRSQVAVMLTKNLELEIPGDLNVALQDYRDVDEDHRYAEEIAAVTAAGVFKGTLNGNFNPYEPISRQQMATVLVEAFDLNEYYEGDDVIINLDKVSADHQANVRTLANLGITNQLGDEGDNNYNGYDPISRAAFATFLHKTNQVLEADEEDVASEVANVRALNAKQIEVEFSTEVGDGAGTEGNYEVKTAANDEVNAVQNAQLQADGKTVVLTLSDSYDVATDVIVTVEGVYEAGSIKDLVPKFSTVINVHDTTAPTVEAVNAKTNDNAAQSVTVEFSEPISNNPTFRINGKSVEAQKTGNEDVFEISGQNLSADEIHTLEVLDFEDYAGHEVDYVETNFSVTQDTEKPVGKVGMVSDNRVTITFDKAMNLNSLDNVDILRYDDESSSYVPVALEEGNEYSLDGSRRVATFNIAGTEVDNFFGINDTTELLLVKVKSGVIDALGNQVTPFEDTVIANQDQRDPALTSVTYDKDSKGAATKLYFEFDEVVTFTENEGEALRDEDVTVTDLSTNRGVAFNDIFAGNSAELASDGRTLIVTLDKDAADNNLESGEYSFTVREDLVNDTSFATNGNALGTIAINFGEVENKVTVENTTINSGDAVDNLLTVNFSNPVTAESAKDPANYSVNGTTLPEGSIIEVVNDTTVEFTLPVNTVEDSDEATVLKVSNVEPQNSSASFEDYVGPINALDNTAPTAEATLLDNGVIQLTFSENVTIVEEDFLDLVLNDKEYSTEAENIESTTLADGTQVVNISVTPEVSENHDDTGRSYLYLDVDGKDGLDLQNDIVLKSVDSETADEAWYDEDELLPADLNLLKSVEISLSNPGTYDESDLNNNQTKNSVGNKLAGSSIEVK